MSENILTNRKIFQAALLESPADINLLRRAIQDCLASGDAASLAAFSRLHHPADLARFLVSLKPNDISAVLPGLPLDAAAEAFGYLPDSVQGDLARRLGRTEFAQIVSEMSADERADLFIRLSEEERETLLPALAHAEHGKMCVDWQATPRAP